MTTKSKVHIEKAILLLCEGKSLTEIGKEFGVTRERIRQKLSWIDGYEAIIEHNAKKRKEECKVEIFCQYCNRKFKVEKHRAMKAKFCSRECLNKAKPPKTPEEKRIYNRNRTRKYYQKHKNDQRFKEKIKQYNRNYLQKLKTNPEKLRRYYDKQKEYAKKRYHSDPEFRKRLSENSKRAWRKLKADPIRYKKYLDRKNERKRLNYNSKKGKI